MTLASTPRIAFRLGLLALPLLGLPCLAFGLAILDGLRAEFDPADPVLHEAAARLLLCGAVAGFVGFEAAAFLLGRSLLRRAGALGQVASDATALDFRRAPPPGDVDELGQLGTALGRCVRHLTRRRQELDWMASEIASQGLVAGIAGQASGLLAPLNAAARFAIADPEPAELWLDAPLHRLLCALAGSVVCLAAAPLDSGWWAAVAAVALLGGRQAERLRRLSPSGGLLIVAAALSWWLFAGPAAVAPAHAIALAAGIAVHFGGGWRGPTGAAAADAEWLRGGLAGALAGGGVAAALLGILGVDAAAALAVPPLLVALGATAACLAPGSAIATPPDWLSMHAALRVLRQEAARRAVFGSALPGGLALGAAAALAIAAPGLPVGVAVGMAATACLVLALPAMGITTRPWRFSAAALLAAAAILAIACEAAGLAALPATVAAVLVWPNAEPEAGAGTTPRQTAILSALLRGIGCVAALAVAPLMAPGLPAALAAAALVAGALPARRG